MRPSVLFTLTFTMFLAFFSAVRQFDPETLVKNPDSGSDVTAVVRKLDPGRFEPYSCRNLLDQVKNRALDVLDPNEGWMYARQTVTTPSFWVSVHNRSFDGTRWGIMQIGRYYEKVLMEDFDAVLRKTPPGSRVIDVGGNIGFFTLLSASITPVAVDAFEPNPKNHLRFCESLALNRWYSEYDVQTAEPTHHSSVNLYPFGVGNEDGFFQFLESSNPGQGAFRGKKDSTAGGLRVIKLDDFARERGWYETRPHIAILKVDVEGFERNVFEGATEFLKSKLAQNIFMELSVRKKPEKEDSRFMVKLIADAGYTIYKQGGWPGPDKTVHWVHDATLPDEVVKMALTHRARQLNLWWTATNQFGV